MLLEIEAALSNGQKLTFTKLAQFLHLKYPNHSSHVYLFLKEKIKKFLLHDPVVASLELPSDSESSEAFVFYFNQLETSCVTHEV